MQPFQRVAAVAVPLAQPNVDTDQIIPSRYLQKPRSVENPPTRNTCGSRPALKPVSTRPANV